MIETATKEQSEGAIAYEQLWVPALFGQWAKIIATEAHLESDHRVLDVACGTGVLTREIASKLEKPNQVTGIDPNPGMLSVSMEHNTEIEWKQGSAEHLPFQDGHFDAVLCQFGLMFFSDRVKAIQEMTRVLAPGGRLVLAVWDALENIPAYSRSVALIAKYAGSKAREALNGPFELGDKELLRATFIEAGVQDIKITTHTGTARFQDLKSMIEADVRGWLPVVGISLAEEDIQEIFRQAANTLGEYISSEGKVSFDITAHVVTYQS